MVSLTCGLSVSQNVHILISLTLSLHTIVLSFMRSYSAQVLETGDNELQIMSSFEWEVSDSEYHFYFHVCFLLRA
jgi:hypothetical protein